MRSVQLDYGRTSWTMSNGNDDDDDDDDELRAIAVKNEKEITYV